MLKWALIFFLAALVFGLLGFFALTGVAASIAKILLLVFIGLLLVNAFSDIFHGHPQT